MRSKIQKWFIARTRGLKLIVSRATNGLLNVSNGYNCFVFRYVKYKSRSDQIGGPPVWFNTGFWNTYLVGPHTDWQHVICSLTIHLNIQKWVEETFFYCRHKCSSKSSSFKLGEVCDATFLLNVALKEIWVWGLWFNTTVV